MRIFFSSFKLCSIKRKITLDTKEKGEKILEAQVEYVTKVIKIVKEDNETKRLYDGFFHE